MITTKAAVALAERELARRSLLCHIRYVFKYIYQREFKEGWHHQYMSEVLEAVYSGALTRIIINMPPSYGKTEQAVRQFISWSLGKDPKRKHLYATYGADLSEQTSVQTRSIVEHKAYAQAYELTRLSPTQNQKHYWTTTAGGGLYAVGLGGAITGFHGHTLIVDDLLKAHEARSKAAREEAFSYFRESVISRLQDKTTGAIVVIMQRLHEDDLVGRIIKDETLSDGWEYVLLKGIEYEPKSYHFGSFTYERKANEPLFEAWENEEALNRTKREMGVSVFNAQYQQSPETIEAGFFTDEMLSRQISLADLPNDLDILIMVDPAMSLNQDSDDRAVIVEGWTMENDAELIVYMDGWAGKWTLEYFVSVIVDAMERYPTAKTWIEAAGGGHAIAQLLPLEIARRNAKRRARGLRVINPKFSTYPPNNKISKEQKISVLQPYFNNDQIAFLRGANGIVEFKTEAKAYAPDKKHNKDNRLDAFASGWRFGTPKKTQRYVETGRIRAREHSAKWRF
ncbi:MAG: hypothetical protein LBN32_01020 [Helicobacteraceae bacterium]|jgi:hypothetical protein|nr:hypothetical protein [Helicobacteraceae bacterium]